MKNRMNWRIEGGVREEKTEVDEVTIATGIQEGEGTGKGGKESGQTHERSVQIVLAHLKI